MRACVARCAPSIRVFADGDGARGALRLRRGAAGSAGRAAPPPFSTTKQAARGAATREEHVVSTRSTKKKETAQAEEKDRGRSTPPVDRDEERSPIEGETVRQGSGLSVLLWLGIPLILVLLWGWLTR